MKKIAYWLWLIFSILIIISGCYAAVNPTATLISLAFFIGFAMLVQGICSVCVFTTHYDLPGIGWILAEGIITILLSLYLLFNQMFTAAALPYLFAMWVIISGVQKIVYSIDLKNFGVKDWGWVLTLGILLIIAGIISLMNPITGAVALSVIVGWMLIFYGIASIVIWSRIRSINKFLDDNGKL